ncbi:Polyketide synthase, enoylreductase [Penicillium expansum]|uniref:Polyketide synthase, enoylreductase n=1 Tax=Penicillium expansum TaxID=27334 RepID=A0A0A2I446_PENEN|nr:Polyketide synthase, enoylreductase [Penicillium expansum]KGO37909.1 Polyketide synthase, enoylreductase [Penicillium expansum]KGO49740.1 Polyketide synthase, enoylreductase [Penicillium expansum]KGO58562.1 Polyketide synthase, enoylreductase [Penicillium expansum]
MRGVIVKSANIFSLEDIPEPTIQSPTDVIVKVSATTICGSDVHLIHGDMNSHWDFPLGHEFVGTIHQIGTAVRDFKLGDRVVAAAGVSCGECDECREFKYQNCVHFGIYGCGKDFGSLGGAQAEFVRVPCADNCLSHIPDGVSDAQAVTVGDILCTGWTGVERAVAAPGATLIVFGAGPVGLAAIHTARLSGVSKVIAIDVIPERLAVAMDLRADHVINPKVEDVGDVVMKLTGGRGADAIVDAAGVKNSINCWPSVAALGAKIAMVAIPSGPVELPLAQLQMKAITIWMGLADTSRVRMDTLLQFIKNGSIDPSPILTEAIPFSEIETGLREFISRKPGLIKPLILFE